MNIHTLLLMNTVLTTNLYTGPSNSLKNHHRRPKTWNKVDTMSTMLLQDSQHQILNTTKAPTKLSYITGCLVLSHRTSSDLNLSSDMNESWRVDWIFDFSCHQWQHLNNNVVFLSNRCIWSGCRRNSINIITTCTKIWHWHTWTTRDSFIKCSYMISTTNISFYEDILFSEIS